MVVCSLYLLGKAGSGKSSTGNTIVGRKVFKTSSSTTTSNTTIQKAQATFKNSWTVEVVDGPGLVGIDIGFRSDALSSFTEVIKSASADPEHGHVMLIVCRYGERFTADDSDMVQQLQMHLGGNIFADHGVVVVTCGDSFAADYQGEDVSFESWCSNQGGDFGRLVSSCGGRVVLVDNTSGGDKGDKLVQTLETFISDIDFGRKPFTASHESSTFLKNFNRAFFKEFC